MPVTFEIYDAEKISYLKSMIEAAAITDKPRPFEIYVDGLKVVPKTDKTDNFDKYEDFMNPNVRAVKFVVYNSKNTPRNDKFFFSMNAQTAEEAFEAGLGNTQDKSYSTDDLEKIKEERIFKLAESIEIKNLKKQIADLCDIRDNQEAIISKKDSEIIRYEKALELAEENRNTFKGLNVGSVLADVAEAIIRNNTASIAKVPGLSGIAAFIDEDTKQKYGTKQTPPSQETEGSFRKKGQASENTATELTEQQKEFIRIFGHLQKHFNEPEMGQVFAILDFLSQNKADLITVLELLRDSTTEKNKS